MAHGTRINGTSYGITGGKCLVSGTEYSIKKGRTMISGTGYDIDLDTKIELKIIGIDNNGTWPGYFKVQIPGEEEIEWGLTNKDDINLSFQVEPETLIDLEAFSGVSGADIYLNGESVGEGNSWDRTYAYKALNSTEIQMVFETNNNCNIYIMER